MQNLEQSVIRVLNEHKITVGTGFLVGECLAVTCAHVVQAAGSGPAQSVFIRPYHSSEEMYIFTAHVLTVGWAPRKSDDVAFLKLDTMPEGMVPVVLGHNDRCEGHPYFTVGYASLAGYDVRKVNDDIDGIVPVRDNYKHPMLQFKGEAIDHGLSGAPVLDKQTNRVVGMVSEYQNNDQVRFAWATTTRTLAIHYPALQLWPQAYGPKELDLYLDYLIKTHEKLKLPNGDAVPLDRVYVSLRAEEMSTTEWEAEQVYLEDLVMIQREKTNPTEDQYAEFNVIRKAIARHPKALKLTAHDREKLFHKREQNLLSLAEVVQRHPHVVILGDPGSGKTTLGRWLVLQFARTMQQQASQVEVYADQVRPGTEANALLDLGSSRLPIFLRIADYARKRWEKGQGDNLLPLEHFIGLHEDKQNRFPELSSEVIQAITQAYLTRGQALVILDGLDEVTTPNHRRDVMDAVKHFLQSEPSAAVLKKEAWAANRVVLTSRIVGYQSAPLTNLPHYTVEEMDATAITAFCHAWAHREDAIDDAKATEQAEQLTAAIFDHLQPGVRVLAGNPLLLTILVQMYGQSTPGALPARRVALFEEASHTLYNQRQEYWERVNISQLQLTHALAAVADDIHTNEPAGFVEEGDVRATLGGALSTQEQVEAVLEAARDASGFLVARGEGVYGFLHRSLQEYYVAQHLVGKPESVTEHLLTHCLDSVWREPLVLAIGLISQPTYPRSRRLLPAAFTALLEAPDLAGTFLPRRELLAAAACVECERLPTGIDRQIAERLLSYYLELKGRVRSPDLCKSIQRAFSNLHRSPAASETEAVLCAAVQAPNEELRLAAVDLVIETQWDSPALASTLVSTWRSYAGPAGCVLVALDEMQHRQPTFFTDTFLPMRQPELAWVWERARTSQQWQRLLRVLYLSPIADFSTERINRDSPLTDRIVAVLSRFPDAEALVQFRQYLYPLASQPGTALTRDAALALAALGEMSWVQTWVQAAGEHEDRLRPLFASFAFTLACDRDLVLSCILADDNIFAASQLALALALLDKSDHDLALVLNHLFLSLGHMSNREEAYDFTRRITYNYARNLDCNQTYALSLARAFALEQYFQTAFHRWAEDATLGQNGSLDSLLRLQKVLEPVEPLNSIWRELITAFTGRWLGIATLSTSSSELAEIPITLEGLTELVDDLLSLDDTRREHASELLLIERPASTVGLVVIENLAALAEVHTTNPQLNNHLWWALQSIVHDKPDWVRAWIVEASKTEERTPVQNILYTIRHITPEAFATLIQTSPETAPWVKQALLSSIMWLVYLRQIPEEQLALLQEQLLTWLDQETEPTTCLTVIAVLGDWQDQEGCKKVGGKLLDRLAGAISEPERAMLYMALARLAARQQEIVEPVQAVLLRGCPHPAAAAAFVCLRLAEVRRAAYAENQGKFLFEDQRRAFATSLLAELAEMLSNPTTCLLALLDAGNNTDTWDDEYHGILTIAASIHLERFPNLCQVLLMQLEHALEQKDWSVHRMTLAVVAACIEIMPTKLQQIAQGKLENLLVRGATDEVSPDSRRFALTAISYLHTVTSAIVPILLRSCQDVATVQRDVITVVDHFQSIRGNLLPGLVPALTGESVSTAYAVTQLLVALGTSAGGEMVRLQAQITEALVNALKDPACQREVIIAGANRGKLRDALYTALLRVAGWAG